MLFKDIQIILVALCLCKISCCVAQLTFHNDPVSNSFTLKTPGLQQSFTRYFGGKQRGNLIQATSAPLQQQPQQYQTQYQSQYQPQLQAQYQPQYQPQYPSQYQPQYQQIRQPFGQQQILQFSSSSQYQQPSQGQSGYPFEAVYDQQQQQPPQSSPYAGSYPGQAAQFTSAYRGTEYPAQAQPVQQGLPTYADQLQQGVDSYQQEQQQMQQMLQQQQYHQQQLLLDLYKQPQGQGRAVTNSPGRSQAFYTADQYINFLNKQHQDVFQQQQNVSDRGYSFSPMSAYTNGIPATNGMPMNGMSYSPASNSSRVSYTNGKLSYNF